MRWRKANKTIFDDDDDDEVNGVHAVKPRRSSELLLLRLLFPHPLDTCVHLL